MQLLPLRSQVYNLLWFKKLINTGDDGTNPTLLPSKCKYVVQIQEC